MVDGEKRSSGCSTDGQIRTYVCDEVSVRAFCEAKWAQAQKVAAVTVVWVVHTSMTILLGILRCERALLCSTGPDHPSLKHPLRRLIFNSNPSSCPRSIEANNFFDIHLHIRICHYVYV